MSAIDWTALIASLPATVVAVAAIIYSNIGNSRIQNTSIILDFSKRYQDIILAMPDDETKQERYILLYFDLCSEEYRLYQKGRNNRPDRFHRLFGIGYRLIDQDTWDLWEDGMLNLMKSKAAYRKTWKDHRDEYASDSFQAYFDMIVKKAELPRQTESNR